MYNWIDKIKDQDYKEQVIISQITSYVNTGSWDEALAFARRFKPELITNTLASLRAQ